MVVILTYLAVIIIIISSYLFYTYKKSKNKKLLLEIGSFKAITWALVILCIAPVLVELIIPTNLNIYDHAFRELDKTTVVELIQHFHFLDYLGLRISNLIYNSSFFAVLPLLLVASTWFVYLRKFDFQNKDKVGFSVLALGLGALMFLPFLLWRDYSQLVLEFVNSGNILYDFPIITFSTSVLQQELLKIIPLLIILAFTKTIDEPYDYVLYASLSALGFSCVDNAVDFAGKEGISILGKSLLSTVGHMAYSSILVYGYVLTKYRYKKSKPIFPYFILAVFLHASFEYLIQNPFAYLIAIPIFISVLQYWTIIINNCMNNSPFFKKNTHYHLTEVKVFLAITLSLTLVLDYTFNYVRFGAVEAHWQYAISCLWGGLFTLYYITSLGNLDFFRHYWRPWRWSIDGSEPEEEGVYDWLVNMLQANHVFSADITKYKLDIYPPHYNRNIQDILIAQNVEILQRVLITPDVDSKISDPYWFVAKLSTPLNIMDHNEDYVIIKLESPSTSLIQNSDVRAYLRFIPDLELLKQKVLLKEDFTYGGYIMLNAASIPEYFPI